MDLLSAVEYMQEQGKGLVNEQGEVTEGDALDFLAGVAGFDWQEVNDVARTIVGVDLADAMLYYAMRASDIYATAQDQGIPGASLTFALATIVAYDYIRKGIALGCVYTRENIREMNEALDIVWPDDPKTS